MNKVFKKNIKIFIVIYILFICLHLNAGYVKHHCYIPLSGSNLNTDSGNLNGDKKYRSVFYKINIDNADDITGQFSLSSDVNGTDIGLGERQKNKNIKSIELKFEREGATDKRFIFDNINLVLDPKMNIDIDFFVENGEIKIKIYRIYTTNPVKFENKSSSKGTW